MEQLNNKPVAKDWKYIRVKFKPGCGPGREKAEKYSRPKRIYKITYSDNHVEYAPTGVIGTIKRYNEQDFITEWERMGKTPLEKPLRKYSDDALRYYGYSKEEIIKIRKRNFSSKDIKIIRNHLRIKTSEARTLLEKYDGKKHALYIGENIITETHPKIRNTKGVMINKDWKTIPPGEKSEKAKANMKAHKQRIKFARNRNKRKRK